MMIDEQERNLLNLKIGDRDRLIGQAETLMNVITASLTDSPNQLMIANLARQWQAAVKDVYGPFDDLD